MAADKQMHMQGGVAIAVHKSLTSQQAVELINHNRPAAKSNLKTLKLVSPGSDGVTIWGMYLPGNQGVPGSK